MKLSDMKKVILAVMALALLCGCADNKTFRKSDGTEFVAKPYGWITPQDKVEGVEYELCAGNIVWSIVLGETVIAPILFTGFALYEPVMYVEPEKREKSDI